MNWWSKVAFLASVGIGLAAQEYPVMIELCNNTARQIQLVSINPPASWIQAGQIIEPHTTITALIMPHTTITIECNNYVYAIHVAAKEKHPASIIFQNSHRKSRWIEVKNMKAIIRQLLPTSSG